MAAFHSNDTLSKIKTAVKNLLPALRTERDRALLEFGLTEVQGIGFANDFRVYSKIKPEHWSNASAPIVTGNPAQVTNIVNSNFVIGAGGVVVTTATASTNDVSVSRFLVSDASNATTVPNAVALGADGSEIGSRVNLPAPVEAIAAEVTGEKSLLSPKAVFHELERVPTTFSLLDIDRKVALYEAVAESIRSDVGGGIKNTLKDVQARLRARIHYRNDSKVRAFFDKYQTTTCEAIDKLLTRYTHLRIGPADDFFPEMPDDALTAIAGYTKMCAQIAGFKPVYYLIAPDTEFKKKAKVNERRDPILLVQAPFGFYWQILGAWGEEMQLLEEI